MICCECGHEMRLTNEPMKETYRGEEIVVDGIERWSCDGCGNYVISAENASRFSRGLAEAYAKKHRMLAPSEIRETRHSLGLSQKQFEAMLGVTSPSVSRWESGKVQQSKPVDLLIRLIRDVPGVSQALMETSKQPLRKASGQLAQIIKFGGNNESGIIDYEYEIKEG